MIPLCGLEERQRFIKLKVTRAVPITKCNVQMNLLEL